MNSRRWRFLRILLAVCTVVLVCLLHLGGPIVIFLRSGTPSDSVGIGLEFIWRTIGICMLLCIYGFYQHFLYRFLRTRVTHWAVWSVLVLLPVVLLGARSIYRSLPSVRAQQILTSGELGALPESATAITVYAWWTPFSGEEYLRFHADREDIELFVAKAPILKGAEHWDYSRAKMRLLGREKLGFGEGHGAPDHEYVFHRQTVPPWYMEEIRWRARRYRIRPPGYHHAGEVIIDQENNVVFVKLVFS